MRKYAVLIALLGGALRAQVSSVNISAPAPEIAFSVDDQIYKGSMTFLWPKGSKHTLAVDPNQGPAQGMSYGFKNWSDNTGLLNDGSPRIVITADPSISIIKANFTINYDVIVSMFRCSDPGPCAGPNTVYVNDIAYRSDIRLPLPAGSTVNVRAEPGRGYVFTGWAGKLGDAFLSTFTLTAPTLVAPHFASARPVRLQTSPPELRLLADRAPVADGTVIEWGYDTQHTIAAISPQVDNHGRTWLFDSWSDGGALSHAYTVAAGSELASVTAVYRPAVRVSFLTSPPGLRLTVDGRQNWQGYNFDWAPGESHSVSAPQQQTDANGRVYVFQSWSNGGSAAQNISVPEGDLRLIAIFQAYTRIAIQSAPLGIVMRVDDESCMTPCTVQRAPGTSVRIAAPANAPAPDGMRFDFAGWNDGAESSRTVTASDDVAISAKYATMSRLTALADPPEAASWQFGPASPDGYYDSQTLVTVAVQPKPGYRFRKWDGDLSGIFLSGTVPMSRPRTVRAIFDRVPYITPAGVKNAAGETPLGAVAAGSVVSIFGANLAAELQTGPTAPLAQTIGGVAVRIGERYLPLYFVSPEQINVQLPFDLQPGEYALLVEWQGHPEVKAPFTAARNAPGLFAAAAHEDGSAVTADSPARASETVTLYATGLGPYTAPAPEGFALPESYVLADPVEVLAGDTVVQPISAGPAAASPGLQAIRIKMPATPELRVRVNGIESNVVQVPVN